MLICALYLFTANHLNGQNNWDQGNLINLLRDHVSLIAGMNLSNQDIQINNYTSRLNYSTEKNQNNTYQPGFFIGLRMDGNNDLDNGYDITLSLQKYKTGTNYIDPSHLNPFLGSYTNFKADNNIFIMNISGHYKRLLNNYSYSKSSLYCIVGPSMDIRLSNQSLDNQIQDNYKKIGFYADLGIEFNNQSFYTVFIHYKHPLGSFTNNSINTQLSVFELGTALKLNDIF